MENYRLSGLSWYLTLRQNLKFCIGVKKGDNLDNSINSHSPIKNLRKYKGGLHNTSFLQSYMYLRVFVWIEEENDSSKVISFHISPPLFHDPLFNPEARSRGLELVPLLRPIKCKEVKKMDITEYTKQTGMFLKAEDVIENPEETFIITTEGEFVTSEKFGNERLHLFGEFKGEKKTFDCSKTNARTIEEQTGKTDSKEWVGRKLKLDTYKTKTSDGKLVSAINVIDVV